MCLAPEPAMPAWIWVASAAPACKTAPLVWWVCSVPHFSGASLGDDYDPNTSEWNAGLLSRIGSTTRLAGHHNDQWPGGYFTHKAPTYERRLRIGTRRAKLGLTVNTPGNPSQNPCSVARHCDASYAGRGRGSAVSFREPSRLLLGLKRPTSITSDGMIFLVALLVIGDRLQNTAAVVRL